MSGRTSCAQVVYGGHGFMRTLRDRFYRLAEPPDDPRVPQTPCLTRAWDDLTRILAAAWLSLSTTYDDALGSARGF